MTAKYTGAALAAHAAPTLRLTIPTRANYPMGNPSGFKQFTRTEEILFTSSRKMMTTIHKHGNTHLICSKGALEEILSRCHLTEKEKETILAANNQFARKALRV